MDLKHDELTSCNMELQRILVPKLLVEVCCKERMGEKVERKSLGMAVTGSLELRRVDSAIPNPSFRCIHHIVFHFSRGTCPLGSLVC